MRLTSCLFPFVRGPRTDAVTALTCAPECRVGSPCLCNSSHFGTSSVSLHSDAVVPQTGYASSCPRSPSRLRNNFQFLGPSFFPSWPCINHSLKHISQSSSFRLSLMMCMIVVHSSSFTAIRVHLVFVFGTCTQVVLIAPAS